MNTSILKRLSFLPLLLMGFSVCADNWPTHMHDNRRSGVSNEELDFSRLDMAWKLTSPIPQKTAWAGPAPWDSYRDDDPLDALRNFDDAPFVTVVGDQVFVGSSVTDSAYALDRQTGAVQWIYPTDGPVRFPPTWHDDKVYFGSDDGYVYCVNAADGSLVWKYTPIPEAERRLIGNNGRLIPLWPVRTGVAIEDGKVYFAASLTTWNTTYLCALDAATGAQVYKVNGGTTPMGSIMLQGDLIYLLQGRVSPTIFNRTTGASSGSFGGGADCGAYALVTVDGDLITNYDNRGDFGVKKWNKSTSLLATHAKANSIVSAGTTLYVLTDTTLTALGNGGTATLWSVPCDTPFSLIKAGSALVAGGNNKVVAYNSADGSIIWEQAVDGRAAGLAVAQSSLVVSTDEGHVIAFGTSDTKISNEGGATGISSTMATLQGAVSSASVGSHHVRLYWGDEDLGSTLAGWDHEVDLGIVGDGALAQLVTGLVGNDTYYYRYAVSNSLTAAWVMATSSEWFSTGEISLSVDFAELSEESAAPATLTIQRPAGSEDEELCVEFSVSGTATADGDYVALPSKAILPAGTGQVQLLVTPIDDLEMSEPLETIQVSLSPGEYILGTPSSVVFTLTDNDSLNPSEFRYQAKISFPGYVKAETLDDFPVLVTFEEGRGGFSYSQCAPGGGDLRFSSALRDEMLSYEIESWNPAGTSYVWVKVPALDAAGFIRAYWGHATKTTTQSNSEWVWNNDYIGVWHLDESTGNRKDSSPDARTGVPSGVTSASGILLGAMEVNSGQSVDVGGGKSSAPDLGLPDQQITVEAWVNLDSRPEWGGFIGFLQDNGSDEHGWSLGTYQSKFYLCVSGGGNGLTYLLSPAVPPLNQWLYVVGSYDGSTMRLYVDGQMVSSSAQEIGTIDYIDSWLTLGSYKDDNENISSDGTIDEGRISSTIRSADWIWATYKTISDSSNFTAIGALYADTDADGMEDDWEIATFGDMITAGKTTDWDEDGMRDVDEFRAGTGAKDPSSVLFGALDRVSAAPDEIDITWYARQGRIYFVEECTNLTSGAWSRISENIVGSDDTKIIRVNTGADVSSFFKICLDYDPAQ